MQTRTARGTAHRQQRRWLVSLIAAACATVTLGAASAAAPLASPARAPAATFRVIPLAPNGFTAGINARGQVAFTEFLDSATHARFYDGSGVRDLGTFGGPSASARALNDAGQVVGDATLDAAGTVFHAFRWSRHSGLVDLNRPGGGNSSANDINARDQVAGAAVFPGEQVSYHAFRWSPRTGMVDLGTLGGGSVAIALNDAGTAVGYTEGIDTGTLILAAKWRVGGAMTALNAFPSLSSVATDINNAGQIVGGAAFDEGLSNQAFLWTRSGGLEELGTAPSYHAFGRAINDKGLVIGELDIAPGERNGFIWRRENGLLVVGTPFVDISDTTGVNQRGQVVGSLNDRALMWTRSAGFTDLNTRIVGAPPELELFRAEAISDNGAIVAFGNTGLVLLVPQSGHNQPPVTGPVKFPGAARADALLSFAASFTDVDPGDTHTVLWSWGDGSTSAGAVSGSRGKGTVSGQHAWRSPGIYPVRLTVTDSGGRRSTVERSVVVSATGAALRGEGLFAVPASAARSVAARGAIGSFAFLSEGADARGAAVQVNVAGMALRSSQVDAVALDATRVQYSGQGTVNGKGGYRFTVTAASGARTDGKDRIHVRIAHTDPVSKAEVVDYDNGAPAGGAAGGIAQKAAADAQGSVVIGEGKFAFGSR